MFGPTLFRDAEVATELSHVTNKRSMLLTSRLSHKLRVTLIHHYQPSAVSIGSSRISVRISFPILLTEDDFTIPVANATQEVDFHIVRDYHYPVFTSSAILTFTPQKKYENGPGPPQTCLISEDMVANYNPIRRTHLHVEISHQYDLTHESMHSTLDCDLNANHHGRPSSKESAPIDGMQ